MVQVGSERWGPDHRLPWGRREFVYLAAGVNGAVAAVPPEATGRSGVGSGLTAAASAIRANS